MKQVTRSISQVKPVLWGCSTNAIAVWHTPHMGLSASPFSFRDQLAFYGAYHTNRVNVGIHILCVPLIWVSTLGLVLQSGVSVTALVTQMPSVVRSPALHGLGELQSVVPAYVYPHLNVASLVSFLYLMYYYVLDIPSALLITPLWAGYYALAWVGAEVLQGRSGPLLAVFVLSWLLQFYGHGVHEGRAPALLDNLLGAVVLAPLFVFIEVLFCFGYRPELQRWLKKETARLILAFRSQHAAKPKAY